MKNSLKVTPKNNITGTPSGLETVISGPDRVLCVGNPLDDLYIL
jgi:hypothetical protein